ncbi:aminotransferase class III-fold pyridoxal phosphate-dependent enzyme [Streptomyces griseomycini]|uniref:aminotransferase class III-fold pyridoxal phosphate-dependent enzyme n=1 Tax=Streptomyces griseomycini TaxID=66895 RepID=UPI001873C8A9|nr:aminotransferase class III-fold pyridoxal phosphate-dependent enzyme [Streptomyces griseomycini]
MAELTHEGRETAGPVVPVRARGMTVEDADGRRYLDCLSGAGTLALGHNHPVVLEAIRKVIDSGAPLHASGLATPVKDAFTTELFRTLPSGLADRARVRFCGPDGTDAVATALRLVRAATGRAGVLAFTGAHHALTTGFPDVARAAPSGAQITLLPYPQDYRCPFGIGGERGAELAARWAESVLDGPASGVPLPAGMIVEPVQGDGGVLPAPDAWLRRLRRLTADRSVPLIADETLTGVGRTGAFWAVEHSGITPDVMVLSAAIGGSLPLTVVVHRDDLGVCASDTGTGTFPGNQLAMAAGAATLGHVRENGLAEHAATLGARMLGRLRALAGELACVGEVRGRGLMIGVEMVDPEDGDDDTGRAPAGPGAVVPPDGTRGRRPRPAAPELAVAVQRECLRRGLIVDLGGPCASVVRLLPPLTTTDEQADAVLDRLADALQAVARVPFTHRRAERPRRAPRRPADRAERAG